MQRLRLLAVLLFALLALPVVVFAQDQKMAWDLQDDTYVDVQDLGFRFYYPVGWVYTRTPDKGILLAPTLSDIDAQLDGDDSTRAKGLTIGLGGVQLSALSGVDDSPTLGKLADYVVKMAKITLTARVEAAVMLRRSISMIGTDDNGRTGIGSVWTQNGYLVLVALGVPDPDTINQMAYTWGVTLDSIQPLNPMALEEKSVLTDTISHFTVQYPQGWIYDPVEPNTAYEIADDVALVNLAHLHGYTFTLLNEKLTDAGLRDDATLDEFIAWLGPNNGLETAVADDFIILGHPAVTITGEVSGGSKLGSIITAMVMDGRGIAFELFGLTKEKADDFMPTWIAILQSVKPF